MYTSTFYILDILENLRRSFEMKFINLFMYAKFPILCMSRNVGKNTNN